MKKKIIKKTYSIKVEKPTILKSNLQSFFFDVTENYDTFDYVNVLRAHRRILGKQHKTAVQKGIEVRTLKRRIARMYLKNFRPWWAKDYTPEWFELLRFLACLYTKLMEVKLEWDIKKTSIIVDREEKLALLGWVLTWK